jgi:hypothetical protein
MGTAHQRMNFSRVMAAMALRYRDNPSVINAERDRRFTSAQYHRLTNRIANMSRSDRSSRFRQTPAPISAQTAYRLVPQASSSRPSVGVFLGCWGPISARCRGSALS